MEQFTRHLDQHRETIAGRGCPLCASRMWDVGTVVVAQVATLENGTFKLRIIQGASQMYRIEIRFTCGSCGFSAAFYLADLELSSEQLAKLAGAAEQPT